MPYSSINGKDCIKKWIADHKDISSMVDFGAGSGTYGKLFRQINPAVKRFAIEAYEPYIERFKLYDIYNEVIVGTIEGVKWPEADVAIFGDILEHLEKKQALEILRVADHRYKKIIVSIPIGECLQGPVGGNELEKHVSTWSFNELAPLMWWSSKSIICDDGKYAIGLFIK